MLNFCNVKCLVLAVLCLSFVSSWNSVYGMTQATDKQLITASGMQRCVRNAVNLRGYVRVNLQLIVVQHLSRVMVRELLVRKKVLVALL